MTIGTEAGASLDECSTAPAPMHAISIDWSNVDGES